MREAVRDQTPMGMKAKSFMDRGELVADEVMIGLVIERLNEPDCMNGYILDGFPRTIHQAQELDRILLTHKRQLSAVISLEVEKRKVVERLTSRRVCLKCGRLFNLQTDPPPENGCNNCGGEVYQRSDDSYETVLHRMEVYEESTRPLKDYYGAQAKLLQIDGNLNIEKVHAEILRRLVKLTC